MTGTPTRRRWASRRADPAAQEWAGDTREFDLVKELLVALVVVGVLCVALAGLFSSPDDRPITVARWAKAAPGDFVATAVTELDGTSRTASYGPPYNSFPGAGQELGPLPLQRWGGVRARVDTAQDFVLRPLREVPADPVLTGALSEWSSAPAAVQMEWATAYGDAVAKAPGGDPGAVAPGDYGPVPRLRLPAVHPRPAFAAASPRRAPAHLAAALPAGRGPQATCGELTCPLASMPALCRQVDQGSDLVLMGEARQR